MTRGEVRVFVRATDSGRSVRCLFSAPLADRVSGTSTIMSRRPSVSKPAGVDLDRPIDLRRAVHIWTSSKLPGVVIPDGVTQFAKGPSN